MKLWKYRLSFPDGVPGCLSPNCLFITLDMEIWEAAWRRPRWTSEGGDEMFSRINLEENLSLLSPQNSKDNLRSFSSFVPLQGTTGVSVKMDLVWLRYEGNPGGGRRRLQADGDNGVYRRHLLSLLCLFLSANIKACNQILLIGPKHGARPTAR